MTYSDKVKFILDYAIFLGVQVSKEPVRYQYELSKDEMVKIEPLEDTMCFSMYGDELASIHLDASNFDDNQQSTIDIFYENILSKLPPETSIPDGMDEKVREATEDAHKEWAGMTIIRDKDMGHGLTYKITMIPITGTFLFEMSGFVTKSLYIIRFSTGQFFDISDPIYERLFNKQSN